MATKKLSLKLLIDKNARKVLFAEGGKDFVDFLFSLLTLPVGCLIKAIDGRIRCMGNLYGSVERLSNAYMQANVDKTMILQPKILSPSCPNMFLLKSVATTLSPKITYYVCDSDRFQHDCDEECDCYESIKPHCITDLCGTSCPTCGDSMTEEIPFVGPTNTIVGYVKELVTYTITDDLEVFPMSSISSVALLNSFNVTQISALEEMVVDFDVHQEGLTLLRASIQSRSVLTDVFLRQGV